MASPVTSPDTASLWWESVGGYRPFHETVVAGKTTAAWVSEEAQDESWDDFLQHHPSGQFLQSSFWARAKAAQGWACVRVVIACENRLMGGFQLLWRSSWLGRIGYLSKGPVLDLPESRADARLVERHALALLRQIARAKKLRVIIMQPPDFCEEMSDSLRNSGFLPGIRTGVSDATCLVDLSGGFDAVERRMDRTFRKCVDRAGRANLQVRQGSRSDLAAFFQLMRASCRRQNASPNPSDLRHLLALWDAAHPRGAIRLHVVESEGEPVAGQLDVLFGATVTFWKKGWSGAAPRLSPNDVCMYEGIRLATQEGYARCDFASFDRTMAVSILNGDEITAEQARTRYVNFFRTGGKPVLLPRAYVFLPNPILQAGYRLRYSRQIASLG